jgi:hypothetical protein
MKSGMAAHVRAGRSEVTTTGCEVRVRTVKPVGPTVSVAGSEMAAPGIHVTRASKVTATYMAAAHVSAAHVSAATAYMTTTTHVSATAATVAAAVLSYGRERHRRDHNGREHSQSPGEKSCIFHLGHGFTPSLRIRRCPARHVKIP